MEFTKLQLSDALLKGLKRQEIRTMTPVQQEALPLVLKGKDIVAQAQTGSGKTLSFVIPILESVAKSKFSFQALILVPTRELAKQIADVIRITAFAIPDIKVLTLIGGEPLSLQKEQLERGAHIVVATPGRVIDFIGKDMIRFDTVSQLVLDEADKMLDMGFYDDILTIVNRVQSKRQTMLFSATFDEKLLALAQKVLDEPQKIEIASLKPTVDEYIISYQGQTKERLLLQSMGYFQPQSTLIFANTKEQCKSLENFLQDQNLDAKALHGDLDQKTREEVLFLFENGTYNILIATDVASRGLDVDSIDLVINFDLPFDKEVYIHRIGRTGRAGKSGQVVSFYRDSKQLHKLFKEERSLQELEMTTKPEIYHRRSCYKTVLLFLGKKDKIRKGDVVGALCRDAKLDADDIGMMKIEPQKSFIAVKKDVLKAVENFSKEGKIKGKRCKIKIL